MTASKIKALVLENTKKKLEALAKNAALQQGSPVGWSKLLKISLNQMQDQRLIPKKFWGCPLWQPTWNKAVGGGLDDTKNSRFMEVPENKLFAIFSSLLLEKG